MRIDNNSKRKQEKETSSKAISANFTIYYEICKSTRSIFSRLPSSPDLNYVNDNDNDNNNN